MSTWPLELFDFAYIPDMDQELNRLAALAEDEDWEYKNSPGLAKKRPILHNYIRFTYKRLAEEGQIELSDDGQMIVFDTGLVTKNQEPIFALFSHNYIQNRQPWHFKKWCRKGEGDLNVFSALPDMAHYFTDPSSLIFDRRKELRINYEHIIQDNKDRFPEPYKSMEDHTLQIFLKGYIDNVKERIKRNYKTAVPQYYNGNIQLLLPLCMSSPSRADLALVAENKGNFYRIATCLTLDMAYNNARQLARPDKDWLQP
ncbi:MAG: DUF3825 domain-containing protein [Magnetococcus sp. DMHC-1]|nr:DUF3825 domain-containing protein [Magnetococcales bacterium]